MQAMRSMWRIACLLLLGTALPAAAQQASVQSVARYTGADRQAMLEADARREGALTIYMTGTQMQPLIDAFQKRYPFIKAQIVRGDTTDIDRRVVEEYGASTFTVDAFELAVEGLVVLRDEGFLQPFNSPETARYDQAAVEPQLHWVSARETYVGIGYNTQKLAPADAPQTYDDLMKPSLKGRMALTGAQTTAANWVGAMVLSKGEDFVRKLGAQQMRVYAVDGRAVTNLMISGEIDISPTTYLSQVVLSKSQGAPLAWVAPGPVYVLDTATALAAKAPHPNAAMLLIDFLLSMEGQFMYRDIGYLSARTDMPPSAIDVKDKLFLGNRPTYVDDYARWLQLFRDVFVARQAP